MELPQTFRERLANSHGRAYWRSLDELAGTPEFLEFMHREFPHQASEWTDPASRRQFMRVMGASLALASVSGCAYTPTETITPYVKAPEELIPGKPLQFASALTLGGYAAGVLVESHMGRPTKVEGNPLHPQSLGGTDTFSQASVLTLYDPDRSQLLLKNGRPSVWGQLVSYLTELVLSRKASKGQGLAILTGAFTSPTLSRQVDTLTKELPELRWYVHEPVGRGQLRQGLKLAFGVAVEPVYAVDKADVILSLGSDFLSGGPQRLSIARQFAKRREPAGDPSQANMNRLYVAEHTPTITGAISDHRLPAPSRQIAAMAHLLASRLEVKDVPAIKVESVVLGESAGWFEAVLADLIGAKGRSLVMAGDEQPPEVHALVAAINEKLGNTGATVSYVPALVKGGDGAARSLADLVSDIQSNRVDSLVVLDSNPAYSAPADLNFTSAWKSLKNTVHLGLYDDETAALAQWHVPQAHELEAWGDALAADGTATIQQPLINPLYGGKTSSDVLDVLLDAAIGNAKLSTSGLASIQETWRESHPEPDFDAWWNKAVHDGIIPGSVRAAESVTLGSLANLDWKAVELTAMPTASALELNFVPDPTVHDGRFANNGWLQELPKPLSKITWDNALYISYANAHALGLKSSDMVELTVDGRTLAVAVWVQPGQAEGTATLHLGYGRTRAGKVGSGAGFNAYALRTSTSPSTATVTSLKKIAGKAYALACTQQHWNVTTGELTGNMLPEREIIRWASLSEFRKNPKFAHGHLDDITLYPPPEPQRVREEEGVGNAWAMVINLNTCIGCGVCTIACQAENNIPVVGKEQVIRQREMHWIRVDHYYQGMPENPAFHSQPVPCMHCEKAPCELVCPVAATTHSAEGLNEMTYNRCVGTRYCGNNCPYKVRRFNFLRYSDLTTPSLKLQRNPDVTVRTRGIMEKCTYCVQRINQARIESERDGRVMVRSAEVVTACQAACPTQAIVFGNLNDTESELVQAKNNPRNYAMLESLNVRPRTTYLAKLSNPNNNLAQASTPAAAPHHSE